MWIMTPTFGFLSIVQKPGDRASGVLTIRSRARDHLQAFIDMAPEGERVRCEIQEDDGTDYAYRCQMPRELVGDLVMQCAENIQYSNFKNACHRNLDNDWCAVLGRMWKLHYDYQDRHA